MAARRRARDTTGRNSGPMDPRTASRLHRVPPSARSLPLRREWYLPPDQDLRVEFAHWRCDGWFADKKLVDFSVSVRVVGDLFGGVSQPRCAQQGECAEH